MNQGEVIQTINCPHCQQLIVIDQINCGIFRCGIDKQSGEQIPPHAPKTECDRLVIEGRIYGCGRPFRVQVTNGQLEAIICDYI